MLSNTELHTEIKICITIYLVIINYTDGTAEAIGIIIILKPLKKFVTYFWNFVGTFTLDKVCI